MIRGARSRGELLLSEEIRVIVDDMASTAVADTPAQVAVGHDPMLRTMMREAVLDADAATRYQAAVAIGATPYAPALIRLARSLAHSELPVLAARMQEMLIFLGGAGPGVEPIESALAEQREAIRARALIAIGMRRVGLQAGEESAIVDHTVEADAELDRAAGLAALGMAGSDSLDRLSEHEDLGPAARWWHQRGPALHDPDFPAIA